MIPTLSHPLLFIQPQNPRTSPCPLPAILLPIHPLLLLPDLLLALQLLHPHLQQRLKPKHRIALPHSGARVGADAPQVLMRDARVADGGGVEEELGFCGVDDGQGS